MREMKTLERRSINGVGLGLRSDHYAHILKHRPDIAWFEALSDNYINHQGPSLQNLLKIRAHYPMTLHGVGLSLGSQDPLNQTYLKGLKDLIDTVAPAFVSDHLCWISLNNRYYHELLPLTFTEEAITHVANRIQQVQDTLKQQILIENVSSYLSFENAEMTEAKFLAEVAKKADCLILLDINNIYVNANNHGFDANTYFDCLPKSRVCQYHLAGFEDKGTHLFDSHSRAVHTNVWALYEKALETIGVRPTLIEWDSDIPAFEVLENEAKKSTKIAEKYAVKNTTSVC